MEMSLIKKDKKDWTRFKLTLKEFSELRGLLDKFGIDTSSPSKKSSRFIYFEKEGDFLNDRK